VAEDPVTVTNSEPPFAGESANDIPFAGQQSVNPTGTKKKKKNNRRSPAALERKRLKRKENRKVWGQRLRQEWHARVKAATAMNQKLPGTSAPSSDGPIRNRVYYEELVPSSIGTYYRPGPASVVRNVLPAGFYEESEEYAAEELMEPEDRPWMKGHKKPLPPPPAAIKATDTSTGVHLMERERQCYYESPSVKMARYAVRDQWRLAEREILVKRQDPTLFPRNQMPSDTVGDLRNILKDPHRVIGFRTRHNHSYKNREPAKDDKVIVDFLREVRRTRVVCLNTEGTETEMVGEQW
jgi:hypothetical protein